MIATLVGRMVGILFRRRCPGVETPEIHTAGARSSVLPRGGDRIQRVRLATPRHGDARWPRVRLATPRRGDARWPHGRTTGIAYSVPRTVGTPECRERRRSLAPRLGAGGGG